MPSAASSRIASGTRSSLTDTYTSSPRETSGHAISDGVAQLRPAIIESCGSVSVMISPASTERSTHAADTGSTPTSAGAARRAPQ